MSASVQPGGSGTSLVSRRVLLALAAGALWAGCSTVRQIPFESIPAEGTGQAAVVTTDGYTFNFDRVEVRGDSLVGTYAVVEERVSAGGAVAYVDVPRHSVMARERVAHLEIKQLDYGNTALLGAGAVLFTVWAASLDDEKDIESQGGGGKRNPSDPIQ
jgi:hypothetical protein